MNPKFETYLLSIVQREIVCLLECSRLNLNAAALTGLLKDVASAIFTTQQSAAHQNVPEWKTNPLVLKSRFPRHILKRFSAVT